MPQKEVPQKDMPQKIEPIRATDPEARLLAERLLRTARHGALGTNGPDGHPFVSLVSLATDGDGSPLILVSRLSNHTTHMLGDARCSLLVGEPGRGDPLAHPRMTLTCAARVVEHESEDGARMRRRFLARQPKAALYVDFGDFLFFVLEPLRASLNGGFGKAFNLGRTDILVETASDLMAAEESAIAHMNEDHAEAVALLARLAGGAASSRWRIVAIDSAGCDISSAEDTVRLYFPERIQSASALHTTLMALVSKARQSA